MKQYFTWGSTLFTIIALVSITIGSPIWLMILCVISIISLILSANRKSAKVINIVENIGSIFALTFLLIWATTGLGFFGFGIVLFGYWIYFLLKYLNKPGIKKNGKSDGRRIGDMLIFGVIYTILLFLFLSLLGLLVWLFFLR